MINSVIDEQCKLHYLDLGERNSTRAAVLFLHGWGLEGRTFLPSLRLLAAKRRVIAPDLPGFGQTQCARDDWDYDRLASVMAKLLYNLGIQKVHLIGHSLGAGTCMKLYTILPDQVLSLMLLDSSGIPFGSLQNLVFRRLLSLSEQLLVQLILSPRYSLSYFKGWAHNFRYNLASNFNAVDMPLHGDLRQVADQIRVKTLIVWGRKDRTTPVEMGETLSRHIQGSQLKVLEGNYYHEWSILNPRKFAEIANDFLDEIEP